MLSLFPDQSKPRAKRGLAWPFHLVVLGVIMLAISGCGQGESEVAEQSQSEATVADAPKRSNGVEAPDFRLQSLTGEEVQLSDFAGDVVMVDFWATWCGPCRRTIPDLINLYKDHNAEGFTILGVALERQGTTKLIPYVQEKGITYPVLLGDATVVQKYGNVSAIPTAFLIGRDGTIRRKIVGAQSPRVLEDAVTKLLAEPRPS